jgi:simple sugar transport system permease protein
VVTTLLLNFVMLLFVQMMLKALKDPMSLGWPQSAPITDGGAAGLIPGCANPQRPVIGLVAVVAVWVLMKRTVWGMEIRAVSERARRPLPAFRHRHRAPRRAPLGALAGLAGVGRSRASRATSPPTFRGFGYAGIVVAMLAGLAARRRRRGAVHCAVFVGADSMSRGSGSRLHRRFRRCAVLLCVSSAASSPAFGCVGWAARIRPRRLSMNLLDILFGEFLGGGDPDRHAADLRRAQH